MTLNIKQLVMENHLAPYMREGNFGIEKEGLRTLNETADLALTPHPKTLGSRSWHPYVTTDFSESQPELVTPVLESPEETEKWLAALSDVLHLSMREDEYIWPFSMPGELPANSDIPIAQFEERADVDYRKFLAENYGKRIQMISGVHYNFSLSDVLIEELYKHQSVYETPGDLRDYLHLKMARNFERYEWYLLYLFAASPYALPSFYGEDETEESRPYIRSIRNGDHGYHNDDSVVVRYDTVEHYVRDLKSAIESGALSSEREFYGNARLRSTGLDAEKLLTDGVRYVEFRSFDVNPYAEYGLTVSQIAFIHLFLLTMIWLDEVATQSEMEEGARRMSVTAKEDPFAESAFIEEGKWLLEQMKEVAISLKLPELYQESLEVYERATYDPSLTLSASLVTEIETEGYRELGQRLGMTYKKRATDEPYALSGFKTFEMSTQMLIFDALQLGVNLKVLDASDQMIELMHDGHREIVKNGNMTSRDTTISHFVMENKTVTKRVLDAAGYAVPGGYEFSSVEEAMNAFDKFRDEAIVIKPKSTNYGWGISVFKQPPSEEALKEALKIAFEYDDAVLVEEFAPGTEYRFFVLNGKTEAVLLREPANVVGDGHSTISELIDEKNKDPLRGANHQTPMGRLEKGSIEELMLREQGLDFETVIEPGERVYLRENSNISTGGDSIDMTDRMDASYRKVAEGIAASIPVNVTGIDLIIPDYTRASTAEEPGYVCLEANFNPAMNMHAFVTEGQGRRLSRKILAMLYPELMDTGYWLELEQ